MAGSINKVTLVGNLGQDPRVSNTQSGTKVVNLTVATSDSWKDKATGERKDRTEWHRVVIFNPGLAETAERYLNHAIRLEDDLDTQILESFIDLRLDRKKVAQEKLELLNKNYPEHIEIALKLAEIYNMNRDKEKAKTVVNKLVKVNPKALKDRRVQKYSVQKSSFLGSNTNKVDKK